MCKAEFYNIQNQQTQNMKNSERPNQQVLVLVCSTWIQISPNAFANSDKLPRAPRKRLINHSEATGLNQLVWKSVYVESPVSRAVFHICDRYTLRARKHKPLSAAGNVTSLVKTRSEPLPASMASLWRVQLGESNKAFFWRFRYTIGNWVLLTDKQKHIRV